jgi:hypothetical protein
MTSGIEVSSVPTCFLILGIAFTVLRGLKTLKILKALSLTLTETKSTNLQIIIMDECEKQHYLPSDDNDKINDVPPVS